MSERWRVALIVGLAFCCGVLVWAGLTAHRPWLGLMYLTLAIMLLVPMVLLVP